ncbi:Double-strand break repair protein MRE11 [Dichanthelium oligosanthes]|uniref:Double-strand break repair protein MRE11 n=1 Tax=Dichanthelium oligosanthes TaxID=888268 RepID=A0A1E5WJP8_9POAL|nr:Double-strand break repair protein MRE11 [Dichanthelium oligosanthes]
MRILVATDCHLGYLEKDEVRRFDSFDTFEEICSLAEKNKVDFLLLGGDLFHEDKPSNSTLVKAIEILRCYCMNNRRVQFQVISDQAASLQNRFAQVNYEDPSYNIGLPVFAIHGNRDGPTGVDNLSANYILSAGNLLNYFGKMDLGCTGVGKVTVYPVLIRKGETYVALYGLGNIRDGRLSRMLHEVPGRDFHITQPGSSIATSLINAEAKPKHVLLLEIKVVLEDQVDIDPSDEATIHAHLHKVVSILIEKSRETTPCGSQPKLPLVRIKVVYSGLSTINSKQFGQKYVGKVANPQDILLLTRSGKRHGATQESTDSIEELCPSDLNQHTIEALIAQSNLEMPILSIDDLNTALHDFVKDDDKMAFHSCLQRNIQGARSLTKEALSKGQTSSQTDTPSVFEECSRTTEEQQAPQSDDDPVESSDLEESGTFSRSQQAGRKRRATPGGGGVGGSAAGGGGRRKTDLASFQRAPAKEDNADAAKKRRAPVAAGRYGAVIRRR